MSIKFGTSGWRAVIADEFTFPNVRKASRAIADYVKSNSTRRNSPPKIIIGYDTRFNSKEFALSAANILASNGIKVFLTNRDTPTPVISFQIIDKMADGGINITASHNPPEYNGLKFSPSHGGPAAPAVTKAIEKHVAKIKGEVEEMPLSCFKYPIEEFNPKARYIERIKKLICLTAIRRAKLKVIVDLMHGTGRGYLDEILKDAGCKIEVLNKNLDPLFGGHPPEPAKENLDKLIAEVKKRRANLGLALDGDADRFGIADEKGRFYTPNEVISLLFKHLVDTRERLGQVARTHSTTTLIDRIAHRYGIEVIETPIGFKYIGEVLSKKDCIIGGEESGGLSIANHLPEKDGILACLLVVEMVAMQRKKLSRILKDLYREFGKSYPGKLNFTLTEDEKSRLLNMLDKHPPKKIAGLKISESNRVDGYKFILEDSSWVLIRPSGTEPLVRCHFEGTSHNKAKKLATYCQNLIRLFKLPLKIATPPEED
ncbi:MAG: hypothetical protein AMJ78_07825 [Omnitrophica WOR_2 bacterium SM23_29]|nr:MAG: hypothetical protein AMJ78_07825 [Omnitrophica WOR_2 bacterium SM23_29]